MINPDPPGAATRPFDFRFLLETPYFYNPAEGNLLFDNIFEMPGSGVNGLARFDLDRSNVFSEKRNISSGPLGVDSPVSTDGRFTSINEFVFIPVTRATTTTTASSMPPTTSCGAKDWERPTPKPTTTVARELWANDRQRWGATLRRPAVDRRA